MLPAASIWLSLSCEREGNHQYALAPTGREAWQAGQTRKTWKTGEAVWEAWEAAWETREALTV
jgi:hypothetical protein